LASKAIIPSLPAPALVKIRDISAAVISNHAAQSRRQEGGTSRARRRATISNTDNDANPSLVCVENRLYRTRNASFLSVLESVVPT
jgi:hypothetical protein